jgi:hypothetical protein
MGPLPPGNSWHYDIPDVEGNPSITLTFTHQGVPLASAAHFEKIGEDDNRNIKVGPALLFVANGATSLDAHYIRQVVFQNVEVHYSGKPAFLENVVFVNCRFVIDNDERGRDLAAQLLASGRIVWRAEG